MIFLADNTIKLCASTTSCGIAAIGYALAQPPSTKHLPTGDLLNSQLRTSNPSSLRQKPASALTPLGATGTSQRQSSSTSPLPPTPEQRSITDKGTPDTRSYSGKGGGDRLSSHGEQGFENQGDDNKRTSWVRRLSTIAPSFDGSIGSPSLNRPSTPSIFSNGSNAPLFSNPTPVTPRNKLVKRSTSQRVLHSGPPSSSPFSTRSTTFRRPATSYQRSEHLRLQSVQQALGIADNTTAKSPKSSGDLERPEFRPEAETFPAQLYRPFFLYKRKKFGLETTRRASVSRIISGSDHISCVETRHAAEPVLVVGSSVQKARMGSSKPFESPLRILDEACSDTDADPAENAPDRHEAKSRNSFSIGDLVPLPTLARKTSRNGSLRRKKGRIGTATGRRIVSAPQPNILRNGDGSPTDKSKQNAHRPAKGISNSRSPSSPLPPFEQFSAFEVDLPGTSDSNNTGSIGDDSAFPSYQDSPLAPYASGQGGGVTTRIRSQSYRNSRVPSEHSTTFGSDNEHSRVFSVDGEDNDIRSETAYDSLRTEASGSSHSGARNYRVESVFGDQPAEHSKLNSLIFQEKLSRISSLNYKRAENFIAEEESVQTPTPKFTDASTYSAAADLTSIYKRRSDQLSATTPVDSLERAGETYSSRHDAKSRDGESQDLEFEIRTIDEDDWDNELDIDSTMTGQRSEDRLTESSYFEMLVQRNNTVLAERPKSNIFEWSERQLPEKRQQQDSSLRPKTAHPQQGMERGGRPSGRRPTAGMHLRSQSVPLPPENGKHRFNNSAKLDSWKLGGKGENEKWDNDFEFDEAPAVQDAMAEPRPSNGVIVPREILESQASVHGQFGQVKELTLLVEELRRLHHQAGAYGLLNGQSAGLWKEAEGIIDLATLDEDEPPRSPNSTGFEFDVFDEETATPNARHRRSNTIRSRHDSQPQMEALPSTHPTNFPSPVDSRQGTPNGRPRQDSVARAKSVLENINQHRSPIDLSLEPVQERTVSSSPSKPAKMHFDTTSLRDLVTRAGVVTRALKEIIRKAEDPGYIPQTPERRSASPPDPPFVSQIFHHNSPHSSPLSVERKSRPPLSEKPSGILSVGSLSNHDNEVHGHNHGHVHMMTVV